MAQNLYKINYIPFRTLSFLFMVYSNSDYATFGRDAGFFCDDDSINQPFYGESISATHLFAVLLGGSAIIVGISEFLYKIHHEKQMQIGSRSQCRLHLKYYYTGLLFVLTITEVLKNSYTKLRPHFLYSCSPDMSNIDCSKGLITQFNCTGDGWLVRRDIYKSFPSGHAALSVYAFTFICIYLYSKKSEASPSLFVWWIRLISVLCFVWAIACCVSRVFDNRHFWWDVFTGAFVGLLGGLLTVHVALNKAVKNT